MNLDDLFDSYDEDDDDYSDYDYDAATTPVVSNGSVAIRLQNLADGCQDIQQISDTIRIYADFLDTLVEDGYELNAPVLNGLALGFQPND